MKLSVIIPVLNEEDNLPRALVSLPPSAEVLVVDGESQDRTTEVAASLGARVMRASRGRGRQMNAGARVATGDTFLFLHADCEVGPRAATEIREALSNPRVVGGSFRLRIAHPGWSYRLIAFGSNLRARVLGLPHGDQAVFVRRSVFEAVGGYPDLPLLEEVVLVRRLRRRGRMVCLRETVITGPRHWEALGVLATTLLNWAVLSLFYIGVSPWRLAPLYHRIRKVKEVPGVPHRCLAAPD